MPKTEEPCVKAVGCLFLWVALGVQSDILSPMTCVNTPVGFDSGRVRLILPLDYDML